MHAVMHTHQADAAAVSTLKCGLLPLTQDSMVFGDVTYHDYEGIAVNQEECGRMANDLGSTSKVMVLRNHGILVGGGSIAEMFTLSYFVHKACAIQVRSLGAVGGSMDGIHQVKPEIVKLVHAQAKAFNDSQGKNLGTLEWAYLKRALDREDVGYKL